MLWLTCRREYCKCKSGFSSSDISKAEKQRRKEDPSCWEYWERKLNEEAICDAFLSAISTFLEDAPEIILLVIIIIGGGIQQELLGKVW